MTRRYALFLAAVLTGLLAPGWGQGPRAGEADVLAVQALPEGDNRWRFNVTVRHGDEGWDHYANKWDVVGPDGTVYGTRELLHPHETEQPFTRSLGGVAVPEGVTELTVRAHDSQHGYGGAAFDVTLPP